MISFMLLKKKVIITIIMIIIIIIIIIFASSWRGTSGVAFPLRYPRPLRWVPPPRREAPAEQLPEGSSDFEDEEPMEAAAEATSNRAARMAQLQLEPPGASQAPSPRCRGL